MGVRSGLRPLQGVQKQGLPSMGGGADPQESQKPRFDPENQGETFILLPWAGSQLLFLTSMAKKRFINVYSGTFLAIFTAKPIFDPEDDRFSSWKQTFSESTQKTGLMTWGSKLACGHSKGSKKRLSPSMGGSGPWKSQKKTLLTLKMIDSALENKHFLNLHKKLA